MKFKLVKNGGWTSREGISNVPFMTGATEPWYEIKSHNLNLHFPTRHPVPSGKLT